jgi:hypothetical protein
MRNVCVFAQPSLRRKKIEFLPVPAVPRPDAWQDNPARLAQKGRQKTSHDLPTVAVDLRVSSAVALCKKSLFWLRPLADEQILLDVCLRDHVSDDEYRDAVQEIELPVLERHRRP